MKIERVQDNRCKFKDLPRGGVFAFPPEPCYNHEIPMIKTETVYGSCEHNAVDLETGNLWSVKSDKIVIPLKATLVIE